MAPTRSFVEVELAGLGVRVLGVHLSAGLSMRGERRRLREIERVLAVACAAPGPARTLIVGDLNAVAPGDLTSVVGLPAWIRLLLRVDGGIGTAVVGRVLADGFTDAFRHRHPDVAGQTMPVASPSVRLDYLMLGPGIVPALGACGIGSAALPVLLAASDHLPVVADLDLPSSLAGRPRDPTWSRNAGGRTATFLQPPSPETPGVSTELLVDDAHRAAADPIPANGASGSIAALRGVERRFDDVVALAGVDLAIPRGSIVGVIGPSGAGKTTAVRLLTGALRPTSGDVVVLGGDPTRLHAEMRARIGFMPQHVSLYDDLTVTENLDFVASLYGMFRRRATHPVAARMARASTRPAAAGRATCPGGMRRRLQLACALVHDPELVFLDEPTAGIDPLVRQAIWRELHRLRDAGRTLVITTQYVPEAEECDTVALIAEGRLLAYATPDALRQRAFGGQMLEVETSDPVDTDRLLVEPSDRRRAPARDPRRLEVRSPDAATVTPAGHRGDRVPGRDRHVDPRGPALVRRGVRPPGPGGRTATADARRQWDTVPPTAGDAASLHRRRRRGRGRDRPLATTSDVARRPTNPWRSRSR